AREGGLDVFPSDCTALVQHPGVRHLAPCPRRSMGFTPSRPHRSLRSRSSAHCPSPCSLSPPPTSTSADRVSSGGRVTRDSRRARVNRHFSARLDTRDGGLESA